MSEQELEDIMPLEDWLIAYKELQDLRAWKARAIDFLEGLRPDSMDELWQEKILTELIKGEEHD